MKSLSTVLNATSAMRAVSSVSTLSLASPTDKSTINLPSWLGSRGRVALGHGVIMAHWGCNSKVARGAGHVRRSGARLLAQSTFSVLHKPLFAWFVPVFYSVSIVVGQPSYRFMKSVSRIIGNRYTCTVWRNLHRGFYSMAHAKLSFVAIHDSSKIDSNKLSLRPSASTRRAREGARAPPLQGQKLSRLLEHAGFLEAQGL